MRKVAYTPAEHGQVSIGRIKYASNYITASFEYIMQLSTEFTDKFMVVKLKKDDDRKPKFRIMAMSHQLNQHVHPFHSQASERAESVSNTRNFIRPLP